MPGLLCVLQCVHRVSGFFCRMCAIRPLMRPVIDAAVSVSAHTGTGFPADFMFWDKWINNVKNPLQLLSPPVFWKKVCVHESRWYPHISQKQPIAPVHWHPPIHPIEVKMIHQPWVYHQLLNYISPHLVNSTWNCVIWQRCSFDLVCCRFIHHSLSEHSCSRNYQFLSKAKWLFSFRQKKRHSIRCFECFCWCTCDFFHVLLAWCKSVIFFSEKLQWVTDLMWVFCPEMMLKMSCLHCAVS